MTVLNIFRLYYGKSGRRIKRIMVLINPLKSQSGNTTADDTSSLLLKQMKELKGRMETKEKKLEESTKKSNTNTTSTQQVSFSEYSAPRGIGRGWNRFINRGQFCGGFGRFRIMTIITERWLKLSRW